jgi:hypothetical protein
MHLRMTSGEIQDTNDEGSLAYLHVTAEIPSAVNLIEHRAGGDRGSWRGWIWLKPGLRISICAGTYLDELQFNVGKKYGGIGDSHVYQLAEDEEITGISGRSGGWMDGIQFRFSSSRSSDYHGGNGGRPFDWQFENVGRIHAIGLRVGAHVERICILSDR